MAKLTTNHFEKLEIFSVTITSLKYKNFVGKSELTSSVWYVLLRKPYFFSIYKSNKALAFCFQESPRKVSVVLHGCCCFISPRFFILGLLFHGTDTPSSSHRLLKASISSELYIDCFSLLAIARSLLCLSFHCIC